MVAIVFRAQPRGGHLDDNDRREFVVQVSPEGRSPPRATPRGTCGGRRPQGASPPHVPRGEAEGWDGCAANGRPQGARLGVAVGGVVAKAFVCLTGLD